VWDLTNGAAAETDDGRSLATAAEAPAALSARLRDASEQRLVTGERSDWVQTDFDDAPQDEMLRFVLALEERRLVNARLAAPARTTALPRMRLGPADEPLALAPMPLPRRPTYGAIVTDDRPALVTNAVSTSCPNCDGREVRVDELDLDAATCVRTCVACSTTFTTEI
jgi:hypothetical protein